MPTTLRSFESVGLAGKGLGWCKTWREPYDHVVAASLLVAQRLLGEQIEIGSDGKLEDFLDQVESREAGEESARELYTRVFGEPPVIPPWFTRSR